MSTTEPANPDTLTVGYVDFIDTKHDHIHIYDRWSRHFVAIKSLIRPEVGQFVEFTPDIPKLGTFKKAVIHRIFLDTEEGATRFGYRDAEIIATYKERDYCSWKLTSPEPIYELGIKEVSYTTGYMNLSLLRATTKNESEEPSPKLIRIIVFLKRYKGLKRPYVVKVDKVKDKPNAPDYAKQLTPNQNIVLYFIKSADNRNDKEQLTTAYISKRIGLSYPTVQRIIKLLESRNLVHRIGSDKTGYWSSDCDK